MATRERTCRRSRVVPLLLLNLKVVSIHTIALVAEAIRVTSETVDKPLSEDGKFDEIYMASIASPRDDTNRRRSNRSE